MLRQEIRRKMKIFCLILLSELKFGKRYEEILDFIQGKAEGSGEQSREKNKCKVRMKSEE